MKKPTIMPGELLSCYTETPLFKVLHTSICPNSKLLAIGSSNAKLHIIDIDSATIKDTINIGNYTAFNLDYNHHTKEALLTVIEKGLVTLKRFLQRGAQLLTIPKDPLTEAADDVLLTRCGREFISVSINNMSKHDVSTGKRIITFKGHTSWILPFEVSKTSDKIVTGGADMRVIRWDLKTGKALNEFKLYSNIHSVTLSPDTNTIVCSTYANQIYFMNCRTNKLQSIKLKQLASNLTFSPDGSEVVASLEDSTLFRYKTSTGEQIGNPMTGHSECVRKIAYSPDGRKIISCGYSTIRYWAGVNYNYSASPNSKNLKSSFSI